MRKLYAALVAICFSLSYMTGYAVPDDGTKVVISQMDAIDYIMLVGGGLLLIGVLFILLSLYAGLKNKDVVYDAEDEYEPEYEEIDTDETETTYEEEEVIVEKPEETEPENEPEPVEEEAAEETEEENVTIDTADEVPEAEEKFKEVEEAVGEAETQREAVVRLTLTGTNNADLKIAEFAQSAKVGRRGTNDIMISDNAVSGEHCEFIYDDGVVYLRDLNSTNGTLLNGEVIEKEEIKIGDLIIIGKHQYKVNISM